MRAKSSGKIRRRRGAATVEFAVVIPLFLGLVLAITETGQAIMIKQLVTNASREACREAVLNKLADEDAVRVWVENYLQNASGIVPTAVTVEVTHMPNAPEDLSPSASYAYVDTVNLSDVQPKWPLNISVAVDFEQVTWSKINFMTLLLYLVPGDADDPITNISGDTTMRKEL